eukprot:7703635-Pyramimonas_sp.AAC.1
MQDRAEKMTTRATLPTLKSYLRTKMVVVEDHEDRPRGAPGGQAPLMAGVGAGGLKALADRTTR